MTKQKKPRFVYPSPAPCPRCHGFNTIARRTDNERGIQYRVCRAAICRWKFHVRGTPVKPPPDPRLQKLACPFCGAQYTRQSGLTKHIKRKHPEKTSAQAPRGLMKGEANGQGRKDHHAADADRDTEV